MESMRIFLLLAVFVACTSLCCCKYKPMDAQVFQVTYPMKHIKSEMGLHVVPDDSNSRTCKQALIELANGVKVDEVAQLIADTREADQCDLEAATLSNYLTLNKINIRNCGNSEMQKRKALCEGTKNTSLKEYCAACIEKAETLCAGWSRDELWRSRFVNRGIDSCKPVSEKIDTFIKKSGDDTKPIRQTIKDFCVEKKDTAAYEISYVGRKYLGYLISILRESCQVCREARELLLDIDPDLKELVKTMNGKTNDDYSTYFDRCDIFEATPECQRASPMS